MLAVALIWGPVLIVFGVTFWRELRHTPWHLLEGIILFLVAGHAIALPVAYAVRHAEGDFFIVAVSAAQGTILALFVIGGAVWVFRRLNRLGEQRTWIRLLHFFCGMLLFPSFCGAGTIVIEASEAMRRQSTGDALLLLLLLPLPLAIWTDLLLLHRRTRDIPDPADLAKRQRERSAKDLDRSEDR